MTIGEKLLEFNRLITDKGFITTTDMRNVVSDDVIALVEMHHNVQSKFIEVMDGVHILVFVKDDEMVTDRQWATMVGGNYVI